VNLGTLNDEQLQTLLQLASGEQEKRSKRTKNKTAAEKRMQRHIEKANALYAAVAGAGSEGMSAQEICEENYWERWEHPRAVEFYRELLAHKKKRVLVVSPPRGRNARYYVTADAKAAEEYLGKNIDIIVQSANKLQRQIGPVYREQYGNTDEVQRLDRLQEEIGVEPFADDVVAESRSNGLRRWLSS